jgi:hypothetical protein
VPAPSAREVGGEGTSRTRLLTAAALLLAVAAVYFTWRRLFQGCDLGDESFAVLVPWRWSLGDRPFVNEMDLAQVAGFLTYPFIKGFALAGHEHAGGIILYARHLYLLFALLVAVVSTLCLRSLLRWQVALAASLVALTFVFRATPDLTYNTLAMGLLTLGFLIGLPVVRGRGGLRLAALAGLCHGLATVAFPTLLFVMPFIALFLVLAQGRQAQALVAGLQWYLPPDPAPEAGPTGRRAFRTLAAWSGALTLPVLGVGVVALIAGPHAVHRCWRYTLQTARTLNELSGAVKAVDVAGGLARFTAAQWPLLAALALVALLCLRRPRLARALLVLLPVGLYAAGRHSGAQGAGFVLAYGLLAPYLFVLLPRRRRRQGATLLIWVWPSAAIAAAMTAYTSADGYAHGAVGLFPAVLVSAVFLAWDLLAVFEPDGGERLADGVRGAAQAPHGAATARGLGSEGAAGQAARGAMPWLALAALAGVLAVTVALQHEYQQGGVPAAQLTARMTAGPWAGISVTPAQRGLLAQSQADLARYGRPGDTLLVFFTSPGLYLPWRYGLATNSVSLHGRPPGDPWARLPLSTITYYRGTRTVPDLVLHVCPPAAPARLEQCGGLGYPVAVVRARYTVNRRPPGASTRTVLAGLPGAR